MHFSSSCPDTFHQLCERLAVSHPNVQEIRAIFDVLTSIVNVVQLLHPECYNVPWTVHEAFTSLLMTAGASVGFLEILRRFVLVS